MAVVTITAMLFQTFFPPVAFALTSGPSAPEVQSFTPVGTSEMVDLFTGDFSYNIPLLELPGPNGSYPFNLSYNSGINMDQEASWVGLGWNLNPGVITREMRGFPDEFAGDQVTTDQDIKPNVTLGVFGKTNLELFGANASFLDSIGVNLQFYYNNYTGFGYQIGVGANFGSAVSLGISLDSQEGVGFEPELNLYRRFKTKGLGFGLGIGYNSRRGLTDISLMPKLVGYKDKTAGSTKRALKSGSSTISFASSAYMPYINLPMTSMNLTGSIKLGAGAVGIFANANIGMNFSTSYLARKTETVGAYGYMNMEQASSLDLVDVNREKDGAVRKTTPNLASPFLTHDIYSISGQGIGGSFRAWRNDIGITGNRFVHQTSGGGSLGFDLGPQHLGVTVSLTGSSKTSEPWTDHNDMPRSTNSMDGYGFHDGAGLQAAGLAPVEYEKWYFKLQGEPTQDPTNDLDYLLGDEATRVSLAGPHGFPRVRYPANQKIETTTSTPQSLTPKQPATGDREVRLTTMQAITNAEMGVSGNEACNSFKINTYNTPGGSTFAPDPNNLNSYTRQGPDHHFAGIVATKTDGSRYVYALPAKNKKRVERQFSVDGSGQQCGTTIDIDKDTNGDVDYDVSNTDKYHRRQEMPEYAHSYLLTSVLGQDYVDADDIPGPSEGDFGFWVKFNYVKVTSDYQWRAPFAGANFNKGTLTDKEDDKGSFMYGEKEVWHLGSAETKTHIVEFDLRQRKDGYGAKEEVQNKLDAIHGAPSWELRKMSLFSKKERIDDTGNINPGADPIKVVQMRYTNDLCGNVPNNVNYNPLATSWVAPSAESGKSTLDSLWFEHEDNVRGKLSPYVFDYDASNPDANPNYSSHAQDRWGCYRAFTTDCNAQHHPYVFQPRGLGTSVTTRDQLDEEAGAWALKGIDLPSGGRLQIDYEADDYGYVQNKRAMEMTPIYSMSGTGVSGMVYSSSYNNLASERRVYFELKRPTADVDELREYVRDVDQLFFKARMKMKKSGDFPEEYVTGYLKLPGNLQDRIDFDINSWNAGTQTYSRAYIQLDEPYGKASWDKYHPMALSAWQYMRANLPKIVSTPSFNSSNVQPGMNATAVATKARSLVSIIPAIVQIFRGYYKHAFKERWAQQLDITQSWIRLNTNAVKTSSHESVVAKVGGGSRVKRVLLYDNWDQFTGGTAEALVTGTVYDYTKKDAEGRFVSSGVAQYEPLIGSEENPFRFAKIYPENVPLRTQNNLFFEFPINEGLYPAPVVGYDHVTVKSYATDRVISGALPNTVPTTGAAVHEFITAKDFPTMTFETKINRKPFKLPIPIPFIGGINYNDMTASQGYSTVLNDMHGKQKKVSNYGQDSDGNIVWANPVSWVEYDYSHDYKLYRSPDGRIEMIKVLKNEMPVIRYDVDQADRTRSETDVKTIAQDHDYYVDMRQNSSKSQTFGILPNLEIFGIFPIPFPWPTYSESQSRMRLASTNKVVYRYGIQTGMTAYNEGSFVYTKNLLYDELTGRPCLTTVTNDYDNPVYSYKYPAHWAYDRMAESYRNEGLTFSSGLAVTAIGTIYEATVTTALQDLLVPGDELIAVDPVGAPNAPFKVTYIGPRDNAGSPVPQFFTEATVPGASLDFKLIRSGRRNMLDPNVQEISALKDPTKNRDILNCYRDFDAPGDIIEQLDTCLIIDTSYVSCVNDMVSFLNTIWVNNAAGVVWDFSQPPLSAFQGTDLCFCFKSTRFTQPVSETSYTNALNCGNLQACTVDLVRDNGLFFSMPTIDLIDNPVPGSPTTVPNGQTDCQIQVDVYQNGSSTPTPGYIVSDCGCPWPPTMVIDTTLDIKSTLIDSTGREVLSAEMYMIDSVLSATATTWSDAWMQDFTDVRFEKGNAAQQQADLVGRHPYARGERGIWRAKGSYVYVTDRDQSVDLNPEVDGTWQKMPMFDFQSLIFDYCAADWRHVNEILRYSPYSYETENEDVLGIRSAALYSYNGKLPIAVAANAANTEIAFEGFEQFDPGIFYDPFKVNTGNFEIYNQYSTNPPAPFQRREVWNGNANTMQVTEDFGTNLTLPTDAKTEARSDGDVFDLAERGAGDNTGQTATGLSGTLLSEPYLYKVNTPPVWRGYVGIPEDYIAPTVNPGFVLALPFVEFTDEKAHTGVRSMSLKGNINYPQNKLQPVGHKPYSLQAWVSREDTDVPFYQQPGQVNPDDRIGIKLYCRDAAGTLIGTSPLFEPAGKLVEGWQKIEGEFYLPQNTVKVELGLQSGKNGSGNWKAYFDDLRFQPLKSKMTTYVYDLGDYRLKAVLDDDNFATIYHYDEAGHLYLVQKETIEGLRTIQESRAFLKTAP